MPLLYSGKLGWGGGLPCHLTIALLSCPLPPPSSPHTQAADAAAWADQPRALREDHARWTAGLQWLVRHHHTMLAAKVALTRFFTRFFLRFYMSVTAAAAGSSSSAQSVLWRFYAGHLQLAVPVTAAAAGSYP